MAHCFPVCINCSSSREPNRRSEFQQEAHVGRPDHTRSALCLFCDLKNLWKLKCKPNRSVVVQATVNLVMYRAGGPVGGALVSEPPIDSHVDTHTHTQREGEAVLINVLINQSINPHELPVVLQTSVSAPQPNCCFSVRLIQSEHAFILRTIFSAVVTFRLHASIFATYPCLHCHF